MPISGNLCLFSQYHVDRAPATAGVYVLYDSTTQIYIGRSKGGTTTIRSRLQDHLSGREGRCTQGALFFKAEPCTYPVSREIELLEEHRRYFGALPRCNSRVG